jgi:hypothetical protein
VGHVDDIGQRVVLAKQRMHRAQRIGYPVGHAAVDQVGELLFRDLRSPPRVSERLDLRRVRAAAFRAKITL